MVVEFPERYRFTDAPQAGGSCQEMMNKLSRLKRLVENVDQAALQNEGHVSNDLIQRLNKTFQELCIQMNSLLGEESTLDDEAKAKLGEQMRCEVLPYFLLTGTAERWYSKPRGYAGDYMTIEELYQKQPRGVGRIGAILDRCFLELPAAYAVQKPAAIVS